MAVNNFLCLQLYNLYLAIAAAFWDLENPEEEGNDAIVGGTLAVKGEFPFMVRLYKLNRMQ